MCGHVCQSLTVHCVKLVIISSLKPCPVSVPPSPCLLLGGGEEATDKTLRQDASVRVVNLCCEGAANITASFIDIDCSDTSKSGPINLQASGGVTGACEGAALLQRSNKCLFDPRHRHQRSCWPVKGMRRWCFHLSLRLSLC